MKIGDLVREKSTGKEGVCKGPVFSYGCWWILVEYTSGSKAIILEECLEVI